MIGKLINDMLAVYRRHRTPAERIQGTGFPEDRMADAARVMLAELRAHGVPAPWADTSVPAFGGDALDAFAEAHGLGNEAAEDGERK